MNFNDISAFLDLVKNPDKYSKYLDELLAQQQTLQKQIEAVGVISEINGLKQKAEKLVSIAEKKAAKIEEESVAAAAKRQDVYDDLFAKLRDSQNQVNEQSRAANTSLETAKQLMDTYNKQQKDFEKKLAQYETDSAKLSELIAEYEDKVAKLRSVMV